MLGRFLVNWWPQVQFFKHKLLGFLSTQNGDFASKNDHKTLIINISQVFRVLKTAPSLS